MDPFTDPRAVADYASETPRRVPGLADLHRMTMLLLTERAPSASTILVVGAGGGLEIKALGEAQEEWSFVGIDPSARMLELATETVAPLEKRVTLLEGYINDASLGPFDGATCLLTLHFLERDERLRTLREIYQRLRPGARLVVAHHSIPEGHTLHQWMTRSATFAARKQSDIAQISASASVMKARLPLLRPAVGGRAAT